MLGTIGLVGGGIIVGLALLQNPATTVASISTALGVRGVTWVVKKVTGSISIDQSQIIDFAGWCIAGVSIVLIVNNAIGAVGQLQQLGENINQGFSDVADFFDKITFWN